MKHSRLALLVLGMLVLAALSCETLESIQQDPSLVQNPDLSDEQREATTRANAATLIAEQNATLTVAVTQAAPVATFTPTTTPTLTPTTVENLPPVITKFTANFVSNDRTTYYEVAAVDPDGPPADPNTGKQKLRYEWSTTNPCGTFDWDAVTFSGSSASWYHPHPPCLDEQFHPAFIRVVVRDEQGGEAVFEYVGGSASGEAILAPPP